MTSLGYQMLATALLLSITLGLALSSRHPTPGIWSFFCYEDTASIDGSSPKGEYSAECWREQSNARPPVTRGILSMVKWRQVEPRDGVYDWRDFDQNVTQAASLGLEQVVFIEICKADPADPAAPDWLFELAGGVNFTANKHSNQTMNPHRCPYYLSELFQSRFSRLIHALAGHIKADLPLQVASKVVGVQAAFGITGDDRPWNGFPIDPAQDISDKAWSNYTRWGALEYCKAFADVGIPVLFNLENPGVNQSDDPWVVQHCPGAMLKQGIVSHGYQLNGEMDLYHQFAPLLLSNTNPVFARGELAVEPNPQVGTYGNWAFSPWWSLQANAEWALTFGLDMWNLYAGFLGNRSFYSTCNFFNRHAGQKDLSKATAAFISFRDVLDTADIHRFPEATFGALHLKGKHKDQLNGTRMLAIANAMSGLGARQDDVDIGRSMKSIMQKKWLNAPPGLNDVCYNCWNMNGGNYGRYLTQLDPLGTSVGRWRVGPKDGPGGYGRFARALQHSTNRTRISLALAEGWGVVSQHGRASLTVTVRVAFFDHGHGRWELLCAAGETMASALVVRKQGTEAWQVAQANVTLPRGERYNNAVALALHSLDGEDDVFSLVEVLSLV